MKDAAATRAEILAVATREFAENGYSGARIETIVAQMSTSKRMIYYYFHDKRGLYMAVVEEYYRTLRENETKLGLDKMAPLEALTELVNFTFDYHIANPDRVRLVMVENIHKAKHLKELPLIAEVNEPVIQSVEDICRRGIAEGVIRTDADPLDIYLSIAAVSFFNVSNRHTVEAIFKYDMGDQEAFVARKKRAADMILRYVAA